MMVSLVQMSGEEEEVLALQMKVARVLEMWTVFCFQEVEVVSCQLAVVDLSLKLRTQAGPH